MKLNPLLVIICGLNIVLSRKLNSKRTKDLNECTYPKDLKLTFNCGNQQITDIVYF
jgi:hypothetical protein